MDLTKLTLESNPQAGGSRDTLNGGSGGTQPEDKPQDGGSFGGTHSEVAKEKKKKSGAARRRQKKQKDGRDGDAPVSSGATKRPAPEHNTPSPSESSRDKRPRVSHPPSYALAATKAVRMALVPENYPDRKFEPEEELAARRLVRSGILLLPPGTRAPTFEGNWARDGAVIFACSNQETADWLKSQFSGVPLPGDNGIILRVKPFEELPKRTRVVVHVDDPEITVGDALVFLDRQNVGLAASEWIVVRGSMKKEATGVHFAALIPDRSLEGLKACNNKPHCGVGRAAIKVLPKDPQGAVSGKTPETKGVGGPGSA